MSEKAKMGVAIIAYVLLSCVLVTARTDLYLGPNFNVDTANYISILNAVSYCPLADIQAWYCPRCDKNLTAPRVSISPGDNLLAYVTDNNVDTIFIVFKGTDPLNWAQWASDLDFLFTNIDQQGCYGCALHHGFYSNYLKQRDAVTATLMATRRRLPNARVVVTGHSLGAAVADIYAFFLAKNYSILPYVLTLGHPRVGNLAFSISYNNMIPISFRVNNARDLVPHLPPLGFGFVHGATLVYCIHDTSCTVYPKLENDLGILHNSVIDHGNYLGVNYFDYISLGKQSACHP